MNPTRRDEVNCPACGTLNPAFEQVCVHCRRNLVVYIGPERVLPRTWGLGSLMGLVAAIAIGLGLARTDAIFGTAVLLILVPAVIRVIGVASQAREDSMPFDLTLGVLVFISSVGLMIGVLFSAFIAMLLCLFLLSPAAGASQAGLIATLVLAGMLGLGVAIALFIRFWRRRPG